MPARLMAAKMDWTGCRLVDIQRGEPPQAAGAGEH